MKENWFKIVIAVVIFAGGYFIGHSPFSKTSANDFGLQEKCASQAKEFFEYIYPNKAERDEEEYSNHYNSRLNKCFIRIRHAILASSDSPFFSLQLWDAVEKKQYGSYLLMPDNKGSFAVKPVECGVLDQHCTSREEFDALVKNYMEN